MSEPTALYHSPAALNVLSTFHGTEKDSPCSCASFEHVWRKGPDGWELHPIQPDVPISL